MKRVYAFNVRLFTFGLVFCGIAVLPSLWPEHITEASENGRKSPAVVLTIAGAEYHYQPAPELGYVVRLADNSLPRTASTRTQNQKAEPRGPASEALPKNATKIGGLGHRAIWIVRNEQPTEQAQDTQMLFNRQRLTTYRAPLYSVDGETIAVIPEIIVRVEPKVQAEQLQGVCESLGCTIIKQMEFTTQEYLIEVLGPNENTVFSAVEELNKIDWIEWATPNTASQAKSCGQTEFRAPKASEISGMIPNDEYLPMQWHLHNTGQFGYTPDADINALEAWQITTGDPNIVIAVLDTGVDVNHPDLISNVVPGYDFYEDDDVPEPAHAYPNDAHGTMCAGLIAAEANNHIGAMGVTWNCRIMPIRIGEGREENLVDYIPNADIATALRWAASQGADVLSNSWGWLGSLTVVQSAMIDVTKPGGIGRNGMGCISLAAVHNQGSPDIVNPAGFREVIAVGATGENDTRRDYSNYGRQLDIMAPSGEKGVNRSFGIISTDIIGSAGYESGDYRFGCSGTSSACPIAAGVIALMLSTEPDLTSHEVRHFLTRSARDLGESGEDDYYGWGRVDARAALDMILAKRADLNDDWRVDEQDLEILDGLIGTNNPLGDIAPAAKRDGVVDEQDFELLMQYIDTQIPEMPHPDLIAHWALDETEGTVAQGSYGIYGERLPDGQLQGNPLWQPESGMVGGALQLDGIDDYISTTIRLDPSEGDFSVFAWIRGGAAGQAILSQQNGANWLMADAADGALRTDLKEPETLGRSPIPAGPPLICPIVVTDGQWRRVGFVREGTSRVLYVDDIEAARDTAAKLEAASGALRIGAGSGLEPDAFWSGLIDDVRIYNRAVAP